MPVPVRHCFKRWLVLLCVPWLAGCVTATGSSSAGSPPIAVSARPTAGPQKAVEASALPESPPAAAQSASAAPGLMTAGPSTAGAQGSGVQGASQGAAPPAGAPAITRPKAPRPSLTGSLTTEYLYDVLLSPSPAETLQNRLSNYLNFRWKNQTGPDLRLYFYGMNSHDFSTNSNDQYRIYKLFAEWNDIGSVINLRVGRQPASGNTLFSRFDGLTLSYRPSPLFSINVAGGFPANLTYSSDRAGMQSERRFYDIDATVYDWYHFGGKLYYTQEVYHNFSTRHAVGLNGYWTRDNVNLSAIVDYDFDFGRLNDLSVGADQTWGTIHYSLGAEYRNNPFLDYTTALADPNSCGAATPVTSFDGLINQLSRGAIESCALRNTSDTMEIRGSVSKEVSKVWRGELRYAHTFGTMVNFTLSGTTPTVGQGDWRSDRLSLFVLERNGLHVGEMWSLLLLYEPATDYHTSSLYSTLSKSWGEWLQTALRFRAEQITFETSGVRTTRLAPGVVVSYSLPSGINAGLELDYAATDNSAGSTDSGLQTRTSITIPF